MIPEAFKAKLQAKLNPLVSHMNSRLTAIISEQHLDPLEASVGRGSRETVNLGICIAETKSKTTLKNLRGLASLSVDNIEVQNAMGGPNNTIDMSVMISAHLAKELTVEVTGSTSGGCGELNHTIDFSGSAKIPTALFIYTGSCQMTAQGQDLEGLTITKFEVNPPPAVPTPTNPTSAKYGEATADLSGMGVFDMMRSSLEMGLAVFFKKNYEKRLTDALPQLLTQAAVS